MKSKRSRGSTLTLKSPLIAAAVGFLCLAFYIQVSYSATIPSEGSSSSSTSTTTTSKRPSRITTLKTAKPRLEVSAGRMKASDIKSCISKAFCEVNSASEKPNYAVNQEFFDLMNRMNANALSDEEVDSGSTSVEYDDDEDEEEAESSEESSAERHRGYPPPLPGYGRYGRNMLKNDTTVEGELEFKGNSTVSASTTAPKKIKSMKKKSKKGKRTNKKKHSKNSVNGTLTSVPKRRGARLETKEEKAEKDAYVTRKQREMGQVNDLAALIRISADIGLTLRSPRKCRQLFNKCTMSHEQIVDLFNQTLLAVTTPQSSTMSEEALTSALTQPTTKRVKVTQTAPTQGTTLDDNEPIATMILDNNIIVRSTPAPTQTTVTTPAPTTVTPEDVNRSSKSRHEFSDEDVEYLTDTEIQPVQTYALFVNDPPEEQVKTEEVISHVQETFKKYANAFPAEAPLPGNLPSLRKRSNKKSLKKHGDGRSSQAKSILRRKASSEEDDEEDDDPEGSTSMENHNNHKSGFRIENPYPGYRIRHQAKDDEAEDDDAESAEQVSTAKESSEGILPPLVQREKPKKPMKEEDDEDEEEEAESDESVDADETEGKGFSAKGTGKTQNAKKSKATSKPGKVTAVEEEESSEEDEVEHEQADDDQAPPPWTPVYQMYMHEKQKQGHKKKQKGPYKGGEPAYADAVPHHGHKHSHGGLGGLGLGSLTASKKPWGGSSTSLEQEAGPSSHSHEGIYGDAPYHHQHQHQSPHGGPPGPFGGAPPPGSQETGGTSEQKPGFFQSILSWFSGGNKNPTPEPSPSSHQVDGPYGSPSSHLPYGSSGSPAGHNAYGAHSGSHEHGGHKPHNSAGAPWPSQPDPAGVGHFGQSYRYRYRPESSEEESGEEVLLEEPVRMTKKNKRRYNGRSDSIITSSPKKTGNSTQKKSKSTGTTKPGPPPPVVIIPKDSKPSGKSPSAGKDFDKLVKSDISTSSNKKKSSSSNGEVKRAKKAAVKPKKKSQKPAERAQPHRSSRESAEDDDEAYSSEELYNQQVAKLKSGTPSNNGGSSTSSSTGSGQSGLNIVSLGNPVHINNNHNNKPKTSHESGQKGVNNGGSFPSYFESMFGTEEKDKYKIKGKDDGSLLFGFDSLSSTLNAAPMDVAITSAKKKPSTYKVNKNKKKQKKGNAPPVQFNNKEVVESSEEDDTKK